MVAVVVLALVVLVLVLVLVLLAALVLVLVMLMVVVVVVGWGGGGEASGIDHSPSSWLLCSRALVRTGDDAGGGGGACLGDGGVQVRGDFEIGGGLVKNNKQRIGNTGRVGFNDTAEQHKNSIVKMEENKTVTPAPAPAPLVRSSSRHDV